MENFKQDAFKDGAKNEEVSKSPKKNEAKGFDYYRDMPGYPADHKGFNKYDSMLEFKEKSEQEINDPEIAKINQSLETAISKKENQSILSLARELASSKAFRAAFVSLMLFAKVGQASAENLKSENVSENKIELTINEAEKKEIDSYIANYEELNKKVSLEANNYFVTDKAEISPENQEKLAQDFSKFLNSINENNFQDVIEKQWAIKGSSDERKTNNWNGSNEDLTKARINTVKSVLENTLKSHDFKGLSDKQKEEIIKKEIKEKYPLHSDKTKEDGVTYISDLVNEKTNNNFTDKEIEFIKKNNPGQYKKLLEQCRYTNFEVESNFFELGRFDRVHFLIDESGSMQASKNFISSRLREIEFNKPIELHSYSDLLNPERLDSCKNSSEAADRVVQKINNGSFRERQIDATLGLLNKIVLEAEKSGNKPEKQKIYLVTDEALQKVSSSDLALLKTKAEENNVEIEFLIGFNKHTSLSFEKDSFDMLEVSIDYLVRKIGVLQSAEKNKKEQKENQGPEKINDFYQQKYEEKAQEMEKWIRNSGKNSTADFFNFLKAEGFGETPEEIRLNLEKEFCGPKNYRKLEILINEKVSSLEGISDIEGLTRLVVMGRSRQNERFLYDAITKIANPLRGLIDAKNKIDLIDEAVKGIKGEIPSMEDNFVINLRDFEKDNLNINLPIKGPEGLLSNLKY